MEEDYFNGAGNQSLWWTQNTLEIEWGYRNKVRRRFAGKKKDPIGEAQTRTEDTRRPASYALIQDPTPHQDREALVIIQRHIVRRRKGIYWSGVIPFHHRTDSIITIN